MSSTNQPTLCIANDCDQTIANDRVNRKKLIKQYMMLFFLQIHTDFGMENDLKRLDGIVCHNKTNGCSWEGDYLSYKVNFLL